MVDPNCFQHERFLDSSIGFQDSNYEYIRFGGGRRMCPGVSCGIACLEHQLAHLLYHFDWKLPNGVKSDELDMSETYYATAKRRNDMLVVSYYLCSSIWKHKLVHQCKLVRIYCFGTASRS